jgi:hypothetical protein
LPGGHLTTLDHEVRATTCENAASQERLTAHCSKAAG